MKKINFLKSSLMIALSLGFSNLWGQTTFSYTGSVQSYTVPSGVTSIQIESRGAQGGDGVAFVGGLGATMQGDFTVIPGQVYTVLVGEKPASNGGGGGSFVVENGTNTPLVIAGGGGGSAGDCCGAQASGMQGVSTLDGTFGNDVGCTIGVGGTGGNGGTGGDLLAYGSGGGSGLLTNGGDGGVVGSGGMSYLNGGTGGVGPFGNGGFGGGGAPANNGSWALGSGGGGGGYSGGAGNCGSNNWGNGGGAGSYNSGTNQVNFLVMVQVTVKL
jgi:hypothetical protein